MKIEAIEVEGYERVIRAADSETGLVGFVAIHSTRLGPACGGLRMLPYESEDEALRDVLLLAKAMTYKSAVARTGLGGGKSVIMGDPKTAKSPLLLAAMGRAIDSLGGRYITAEDMNVGIADLEVVRRVTKWVAGLSRESGSSGNPSPVTARGVHAGLRACAREAFGAPSLKGRRVAIQGVGAVGGDVARLCIRDGAEVFAGDIDREKLDRLAKLGVEPLPNHDAPLTHECDILSPCARGGVLNDETIPKLRCKIVAGAANNQLSAPQSADRLLERGILYAPDYVINAGGIINIGVELAPGGYNEAEALRRTDAIGETLADVFRIAREEGVSTATAADRLAERRLEAGRPANARA